MAAAEVVITETGLGRGTVTVDGWQVPGVRSVTVHKRRDDLDVVTIEVLSRRTTMTPAADAS